jgi:hypothetical protein
MPSEDWKFVSRVENLRRIFNIFKIQGFETPEEMFVVGYLMAHGGEKYLMEQVTHDIELLTKSDHEFWKPIVQDCHRIRLKVIDDDIEAAKTLLVQLLKQREAKIPAWLKGETI